MAEAADETLNFRQRVNKLLQCAECKDTVTDPRTLECGHFVCNECVKILMNAENHKLECPLCHATTTLDGKEAPKAMLAQDLLRLVTEFSVQNTPPPSPKDDTELEARKVPEFNENDDYTEELPADVTKMEQEQPAAEHNEEAEVQIMPNPVVEPTVTVNGNQEENRQEPVEITVRDEKNTPDQQGDSASSRSAGSTDVVDSRINGMNGGPKCSSCKSHNCSCNTHSSLLTPVSMTSSMGSEQSLEMNASVSSQTDLNEQPIPMKRIGKWAVEASASQIEVAYKDRIYVSRWTYDGNGNVSTFTSVGAKIKHLHTGRDSFSGIAVNKHGNLFALNTSKNRLEEYNSESGKKTKTTKLDLCRDPQAVDIMPNGQILVVDQEKNAVICYMKGSKPSLLKHDLLKEPYDIAQATDKHFIVTCALSRCVLKMTTKGEVVWDYGATGESKGRIKSPQGVCVDEKGFIYVVDKTQNKILVLTQEGKLQGVLVDEEHIMKQPWFISVRDGLIAVLFSHNVVRTYALTSNISS